MKRIANGANGCKVYDLSQGKTMPTWLSESKKRALAKDDEYRRRLELIQDFEMTTASQAIKMTGDGEHIIVTGTYPPLVRCYTVSDLAMKFQRGLTCEVVTFETLSDDFGKLVFLQRDRTLNFHAPYGTHYSIRVPKFGRDLVYGWDTCDLYVATTGEEIYRLNLESGQFKEPLTLGFSGCNKVSINPVTPMMLGCGGESAVCEFWDMRSRRVASRLQVDPDTNSVQVTALNFDSDGLTLGVGTSNGNCILYDIRSHKPLYTKEHQYGLPVLDVTFHNDTSGKTGAKRVISTDKKIVKIWDREESNMGKIMTNIETPADINGVHVVKDKRGMSGLIMLAGEQSRIMTYFVPQLGPAPRWCSFLEGLTEELEETAGQTVYEDYKFVSQTELEELGATGLIGTPMLRAYMHGFFMEMKLYSKLRAVSKPFEYEEHRKKKIQEKINANRQSRIAPQTRLPKVNRALAEKLIKGSNKKGAKVIDSMDQSNDGGVKGSQTGKSGDGDLSNLIDSRFADVFRKEEFQIDEDAQEFKLRNPTKAGTNRRPREDDSDDDLNDFYEEVDDATDDDKDTYDDDDNNYMNGSGSEDMSDDGWESDLEKISAEKPSKKKKDTNKSAKRSRGNVDDEEEEEGQIFKATRKALEVRQKAGTLSSKSSKHSTNKASSGPRMYTLADGVAPVRAAFGHTEDEKMKRQAERSVAEIPLAERLSRSREEENEDLREKGKVRYLKTEKEGLVREISFMPKSVIVPKGEGLGKEERKMRDDGPSKMKERMSKKAKGGGKGKGKR